MGSRASELARGGIKISHRSIYMSKSEGTDALRAVVGHPVTEATAAIVGSTCSMTRTSRRAFASNHCDNTCHQKGGEKAIHYEKSSNREKII
jgi:hypothetical protein